MEAGSRPQVGDNLTSIDFSPPLRLSLMYSVPAQYQHSTVCYNADVGVKHDGLTVNLESDLATRVLVLKSMI